MNARILFSKVLISVLMLAVVCTWFGCNSKKTSNQQETTIPTLRLGAMSSMDYLPFVIARQQGVYDSLGLQLEIIPFFSANDRDAALMAGEIDGTVTDYTGAMMQNAGGMPVKMVMKLDGLFYMITSAQSGVKSMADLKGKQIATSNNTVIHYATERMLADAGLMPEDVTWVDINKIPLRLEMLRENKIDASVLPDPFATIGSNAGCTRVISSANGNEPIECTGLIFDAQILEQKEAAIRLLIEGYNEGIKYLQSHRPEEYTDILTEYVRVPAKLVPSVITPQYKMATLPHPQDLESVKAWLVQRKLIPETFAMDSLIDRRFFAQ